MQNCFFTNLKDNNSIEAKLYQLQTAKVGFYSIGLYPASLAYNCAMQNGGSNLLLAPRPGRELLGAFTEETLKTMDSNILNKVIMMSKHKKEEILVTNTLPYLIMNCEIVILASNSKHIDEDLNQAILIRNKLERQNVVLACLVGSFCYDKSTNDSYLLCQKENNLAFFSGFHRHGALRNPFDSFTANFSHPNGFTSIFGASLLDSLSPNIQVSSGVHNVEGQYIKAAKNISSIFAGFAHTFHKDNPGLLPTILTLLLNQCLDQAATVSMARSDRNKLYSDQPFPLTELGYGVQRIEAAISRDGDMEQVRDHTFSQLTAMVADVSGSMMQPVTGNPTRNFQAGQALANNMKKFKRCPINIEEMVSWCEEFGLRRGGLEGITSLIYLPNILRTYSIPNHDSSMIKLLYVSIFGSIQEKKSVYKVMTESRELTNYCQESVRPIQGRCFKQLIDNKDNEKIKELLIKSIKNFSFDMKEYEELPTTDFDTNSNDNISEFLKVINITEKI